VRRQVPWRAQQFVLWATRPAHSSVTFRPVGIWVTAGMRGLTNQQVGPSDAFGAFSNMIPLPENKQWLAIPFGVLLDQLGNIISNVMSPPATDTAGPNGGEKSQVLR